MSPSSSCLLEWLGRALLEVIREQVSGRRRVRAHDLPGLDLLFEASEVVAELCREIAADQLDRGAAEVAAKRGVRVLDCELRPAVARCLGKPYGGVCILDLAPQIRGAEPRSLDVGAVLLDRHRLADALSVVGLTLLPAEAETLRDVRRRDGCNIGDCERGAQTPVGIPHGGRCEEAEVEGVASDARPEPAGRPGAGEDADALRQLAGTHQPHHLAGRAVALGADKPAERARSSDLRRSEPDAEPAQEPG